LPVRASGDDRDRVVRGRDVEVALRGDIGLLEVLGVIVVGETGQLAVIRDARDPRSSSGDRDAARVDTAATAWHQ
jgi:hypothetical protein